MTHEWSEKTDLSVALIGVGDLPSALANSSSVAPTGTPPNPCGVSSSVRGDGRGGWDVGVGVGVGVAAGPVVADAVPAEVSWLDVEVQPTTATAPTATATATILITFLMTDPSSGELPAPGATPAVF